MELYIDGTPIYLGMTYEDVPIKSRDGFRITNFESEDIILLRTKHPVLYKNRDFRTKLKFVEGILASVTLDGRLGNPNFYEVHEEDKRWLHTNFGKPTEEKQWGEIYNFEKFQIIAEVDPRGMDAQITFSLREDSPIFDTTTIDSIGIVDGHLELLLVDGNEWLPDTEQDHLLKLQEKLNNYIHFIESKQYVESYGDDFTEKVINLTFQYAPSDNGLAFIVQVQKVLQPTDIRLKVVVPE
ncbi:DUF6572 domain-containing protein [Streptococcus plurextorum]|uniref:DUF6572 domain-containing protein n=1 Tax=Streptococcus plurextorum TaxID=456876 RepID=UPI000422875D|nr:DUF6572 domain-containing protein [Streptococcus plurextorum]